MVPGRGAGKEIRSPTANIETNGFSAANVRIGDESFHGILSLGVRDNKRDLEARLFDFNGDVYIMDVEVEFLRCVREEKRFA